MRKLRRRVVAGLLLATTLSVFAAGPAVARPTYWNESRWTSHHGWIVKVGNDSYYRTIRTHCHWYSGGTGWHDTWTIYPRHYAWTTSDAGSWGNNSPVDLDCTYRFV